MMDIRPVVHLIGRLLMGLAVAMLLPALWDWASGLNSGSNFLLASAITFCFGWGLKLGTDGHFDSLTNRQAALAVVLAWALPSLFGALPLLFGRADLSFIDALFESTSGFTTTGASILTELDLLPPSILLWRSLLQWLGGLGALVLALAVLPHFRIGGMELFRLEIASLNPERGFTFTHLGQVVVGTYVGLTFLLAMLLWMAGMTGFEALCHAMSTLSTGGFSTHDQSAGAFSGTVQMVLALGMLMGGAPFVLYIYTLRRQWGRISADQQIRWYLGLACLGAIILSLWINSIGASGTEPLWHGLFTAISVITGTGLSTVDWSIWSGLPIAVLFFLTFVGGSAGSTSGGMKVFRFQMLFWNAIAQARTLLRPNQIHMTHYNGKLVDEDLLEAVMGFLFIYSFTFAVLAMALGFLGLDFLTALSGAASSLANLGPGLGEIIGAGGTYAPLPDAAKLLLSFAMILGRVEIFLVLTLMTRTFWRN